MKQQKNMKGHLTSCDVICVGGGPSALSAAIQLASEGRETVIVDNNPFGLGGQAGSSSRIENYAGFPEGISGGNLMERFKEQAYKFGVRFYNPVNIIRIVQDGTCFNVFSDEEEFICAKVVLLAVGVTYRRHEAIGISRLIGSGVSYGSPSMQGNFQGRTVAIVGGANSAGQAALFLSECEQCKVILIIRGSSIEDKMSTYLHARIKATENITIMTQTEVVEARGTGCLKSIIVNTSGIQSEIPVDNMYILIGAKPKTAWLSGMVRLDDHGFIITGNGEGDLTGMLSKMQTVPGIFAAGDVRLESTKRVASAVGEGAQAVSEIHAYLTMMEKRQYNDVTI